MLILSVNAFTAVNVLSIHACTAYAPRVAPRVFPKLGGQKSTDADDGPRLTPHVDMISECGPNHYQSISRSSGHWPSALAARRASQCRGRARRVSDRFDLGIHD